MITLGFCQRSTTVRSLVAAAALLAAVALVWMPARLESQAPTLTLLSREGRRTLPIVRNGNDEMLPLDQVASTFNLTVREEVGAVTVSYRGRTVILTPDQSLASVNGNLLSLSAPLARVNNRWLVPLDFLSRALAPIYDTPLDLHRPSHLLVVGDLRVPRVAISYEPDPSGGARVTFDATPRTAATVVQGEGRLLVRYEADALDPAIPAVDPQSVVTSIGLADTVTIAVETGPRFAGFRSTTQSVGAAGRLILDITAERPAETAAPAAPAPAPGPVPPPATPAPSFRGPDTPIRTVVIDPGHGGDDRGAANGKGQTEKAITLDVARRLKQILESRLGMRVLLTREDDRAIPLDQRTAVANNNKADLFISLHANASFRASTTGATILVAAFEGDEAHGSGTIASGELPAFGGGVRNLDFVLWDLAQVRHVDQSSAFAAVLQQQFTNRVPLSDRPLQRAPFRVLESANMPAVIVEMGYLSNAQDAARLGNADAQGTIAQAILDAVQRFRDLLSGGQE